MTQDTPLWLLAFVLLAGIASPVGAGPSRTPLDTEAAAKFVSRGRFLLAQAPLLSSGWAANADSQSRVYREGTECKITCNEESLEVHECVGRTEIQCLSVPDDLPEDSTDRVDVYTRRCDGKFVNETHMMADEFDTSQACIGLSTLTMREERLDETTGEWMTEYSYKKTCAARFAMTVITVSRAAEGEADEVQVVMLCEGSAATFADNKDDSQPEAHETSPTSTVTCNGSPTDWDSYCSGVFLSVYTDDDSEATTKCAGKWSPYYANWECTGEYTFVHSKFMQEGSYNALERQCSGNTLISTIAYEKGYQICNGESKFNEIYTVPLEEPET